jgi:hypothetical protein
MENKPVIHEHPHPVDASARIDNAYYLHHCKTLERPASYAACLSRLTDIDAGRTNERTAECAKTLAEGRCEAAGMREREKLAGTALFYFPRPAKPFLPVKVAGDFGVPITNLTDPALIPKAGGPAKALPPITHRAPRVPAAAPDDYAGAITAAVAKLNAATPENPIAGNDPALKTIAADLAARGEVTVPPRVAPVDPLVAFKEKMAAGVSPVAAATQIAATAAAARPKIEPGETPLQYARRLAALKTNP